MTSETAQELREGGSSKPRAIEYAGHTLKVGTIWFSSIVNLHCRTYDRQILTLGNSNFLFFLNWIISDLRQICVLKLKTGKKVSYVGKFTSWNLSSITILLYKVFLIMFQQIKMLCSCQQCWSVLPLVCRRLKFLSNDVVLECQKETRWSWQNMCKPQIFKTLCTFRLT